jgi:hypothetical protein
MDAIELLTQQHREVERLFARVEGGRGRDQQAYFIQLARALRLHMYLEEQIFYPAARKGRTASLVSDAFEDHDTVKQLLAEAEELGAEHQAFSSRLATLRESVSEHVRWEEQELFLLARQELGAEELESLGNELESSALEWEQEDSGATEPVRPQPQTRVEPPMSSLDR